MSAQHGVLAAESIIVVDEPGDVKMMSSVSQFAHGVRGLEA